MRKSEMSPTLKSNLKLDQKFEKELDEILGGSSYSVLEAQQEKGNEESKVPPIQKRQLQTERPMKF